MEILNYFSKVHELLISIRLKMHESSFNSWKYFIIRPKTLTLLFIVLSVSNSCDKDDMKNENLTKVEAYIIDAISHGKIDNAEVQLLEWHEFWFSGSLYSIKIGTVYTDANGHFLIQYNPSPKYDYSLFITKDLYFEDDFPLPLPYTNVNLTKFPIGYIKTHVANKIDSARWIDINFTPIYNAQPIFRNGFINCQLFNRAFADTSIITTTIGGITNNLKILINYTDYTPDAIVIKDTSFLTIRHDTVNINIILSNKKRLK
jgi:hypothetical protein